MIRVIDARSGDDVKIGQTVTYPEGAGWTLLGVRDQIFSATARVRSWDASFGMAPHEHDQPLAVRFLHPSFFLQRVGFFPS